MATALARNNRRQGFTLIELLVVVAIIALLLAILMPALSRARAQARHSQCLSNLHQFANAIMSYAVPNRDWIPGETGVDEIGWSMIVAREFKLRPRRPQEVPVDKMDVFQCPERERYQPRSWLGYVHNTLHPEGPASDGNWTPDLPDGGGRRTRSWIRIGEYRRSAEVIFIMDAEREDMVNTSEDPASGGGTNTPGTALPTVRISRIEWEKPNHGAYGTDVMDVRTGGHVPQGKGNNPLYNINDEPAIGLRRAGRRIHLKRFTNSMFLDGHATGVQLWDSEDHEENYAYWLRLCGVRDYRTAAAAPIY